MIEAYGFFAVFAMQVLALSVLYPLQFTKHVRMHASSLPTERLAQFYPGVDFSQAAERLASRYRTVNAALALLGLALLGWLMNYMLRPAWDESVVISLISMYFVLQLSPLVFMAWLGFRFNKSHKQALLEGKRKASLQRRGLFDFISPVVVAVAVLGYIALVAFVLAIQSKPTPGLQLIAVLTFVYVSQAVIVYRALYGKHSPIETNAIRMHTIGLTVRVSIYACILCVVFFAFVFTVDLLDAKRWVPLAQSVCLLVTTFFCLMSLAAPSRAEGMRE